MATKLTPKQAKFKLEYLKDHNGTQAAIRAGYGSAGASVAASRLLKDPRISSAIDEKVAKTMHSLEVTVERVIAERARVAFFDPRKLFASNGQPIPIGELDDDTAAGIGGIEVLEEYEGSGQDRVFVGYTKKYKVWDKNAALNGLDRYLGIGKEDNTSGVLNIVLNLG
ncbi:MULTISPECIES: terminase small subunit [Paraburkholderia]|uniref:terminase small subunit n=1 Tax=Paraburkholderia TaxID=1822464 RepID=UPI0022594F4A|nr:MULTISPECIES: terminase small subunit [Paraburkholderia]MCX4154982.1 terminase small subunit [Paraburkholderia aspalathi]MDN7164392.1 terminase small subunit [Paraburkholderia sp. SECH2]MDQ6392877.1 terminase small subunit [Paraburkholderia aspalathi]